MEKRNYTQVQKLLPEIEGMIAAGKTQREMAEHWGNCYDNAMAENFFSILKTECIYRRKPASFEEAGDMTDRFIYFYNHERIQLKTGEALLARRLSV